MAVKKKIKECGCRCTCDDREVTYLVEFTDGSRKKITVPDTWKVTFGPVVKSLRSTTSATNIEYRDKIPVALRFYESETKQRAIFTNVKSFRDMSILIEEEVITTKDKIGRMEVDGISKNVSVKAEMRDWVNPDSEEDKPDRVALMDLSNKDFDFVDVEEA